MQIFKGYTISPIALVLIIFILLFSGVTRKSKDTSNNLGWVAVSAIVLGIMFGTVEEWIGYVFYGIGVIITCVEIFRNQKKKSAVSKD